MTQRVEELSNGATYRPRRPPRIELITYGFEEDPGLIVWHTHDLVLAESLARDVWVAEYEDELPPGRRCWLKVVPWNEGGHDGDSTVRDCDPKYGTPCVEFKW